MKNMLDQREMQKGLISVIVPVYNVKPYLSECIASLLNQDYSNLEIILIDDGSTDGSGKIADDAAKKDSRIRVIHQQNLGLSAARNAGLSVMRGEYFTFVDSDDYVGESYCSALLHAIRDTGADLSICDYLKKYDVTGTNSERQAAEEQTSQIEMSAGHGLQASVITMSGHDSIRDTYLSKRHGLSWIACGKMFESSFFRKYGSLFPVGKINEDVSVIYQPLFHAEKVAYVDEVLYYYRIRPDSIMTKPFRMELLEVLQDTRKTVQYYRDHNADDLAVLGANYHLRLALQDYYRVKQNALVDRNGLRNILQMIRADVKEFGKIPGFPFIRKVIFGFTTRFPADIVIKHVMLQ